MESRKNGTDETICRAWIETQIMWTQGVGEGEAGLNWESRIDIYTVPHVKQLVGSRCIAAQLGALR